MARQINLDAPWTSAKAEQWDTQTLATFLNQQVHFRNARAVIDAGLVKCFGPKAAYIEQYLDQSWAAEQWSGGCYVGLRSPGAWVAYQNALTEPSSHIHWAGTETATVWNGYIEGAIRSGEDAAKAVLMALTHG